MHKKLLLLLGICASPLLVNADELTASLIMMNNYNIRQDQDVWARMRAGFRLTHPQSKQVVYYEKLYTKNPKTFAKLVNNAKPYIYYILTETEREGMPSEVALLPGVESTFNPNAKSTSNAYGMWQFVPSTGKRFNLAQNSDIDERQDLIKSTQSALNYLNYLHRIFGQWEPAIGAYNWGEGNMYKEVVRAGQKPGNIDYYNLNLREETNNYLPKLIALASIIENPEKFGVDLGDMENKPFFAVVNPLVPTSMSDIASQAGVDKATLAQLNPQFKGNNHTFGPKDNILLPVQNQSIYYAAIGKPASMSSIPASDADVTAAATDIAQNAANNDNTPPDSGAVTTDPVANVDTSTVANAQAAANVPPPAAEDKLDDLITNLAPDSSMADTTAKAGGVAAAAATQTTSSQNNTISYTVASGDTLYSIAKRYKANIDDIRQQNKIPGNDLTVGQTIVIKPNLSQS